MGDIKTTFSADGTSLSQTVKNICAQFNSLKVQIGIAGQALQGFRQISDTVSQALPFKEVLELGGTLSDLSAQTGQSVKDLVVLRQAFENTGLGVDAVGQFTAKLQRALSGVSEEGASTAAAFRMLGTSASQLRGMSLLEQVEAITKGFAGIRSESDRTAVAMAIFGKTGAKALSFFADTAAISQARKEVGGMADVMEKSATSFDAISDQLKTASGKIKEVAAGVLTGLAPSLESITKKLAETDLTGFGKGIGSAAESAISLAKSVSGVKDALVLASEAFIAFRIQSSLASSGVAASLKIINMDAIRKSVTSATVGMALSFQSAGGGIKGFAEVGKLAFSSIASAARSAATSIKAAFVTNAVALFIIGLTSVIAKLWEMHQAWKQTQEEIQRLNNDVDDFIKSTDKARKNVTSQDDKVALIARVDEQIKKLKADMPKNLDLSWFQTHLDITGSGISDINNFDAKTKDYAEQLLRLIKYKSQLTGISEAEIAQNIKAMDVENARREAQDKGDKALREFSQNQLKLEEALRASRLDDLSVEQKRAKILEEVGASSIDDLEAEAADLEKASKQGSTGGYNTLQEMAQRYDDINKAIREYIGLNKEARSSEEARKLAVQELTAQRDAIVAATAAIGSQTEAEKISLKATQDRAKAEADFNDRVEKLRKANNNQIDPASESAAKAVRDARLQQITAETNEEQRQLGLKLQGQAIDIQESQLDARHVTAAEQYKAVEESVFSTEEEKSRARVAALDLENSHLESQIELLKERITLALSEPGHEDEAERMRAQVAQLEANIAANKRLSGELQTQQTYAGQLKLQFTQMFDQTAFSAKNLATTLANSWSSAMDSISQGLTDVIFRAKTLTEAFQEIARTIVTDLVSSFIKMALQYAAQKAFMFTIDEGFAAKRVASAQVEGSATAAAYAPAAASANIATLGGASIVGLAMAGVAIAGIVALIAGLHGFNEGGLIPGSPSSTDNRVARVATGEYIVSAGSVAHYGASLFEALNKRSLPRMSLDSLNLPSLSSGVAFATGGLVGPSAANETVSDRQVGVNVAVINTRQDMRDFMQKEGKKHVVDIVSGAAWQLGIS